MRGTVHLTIVLLVLVRVKWLAAVGGGGGVCVCVYVVEATPPSELILVITAIMKCTRRCQHARLPV